MVSFIMIKPIIVGFFDLVRYFDVLGAFLYIFVPAINKISFQ